MRLATTTPTQSKSHGLGTIDIARKTISARRQWIIFTLFQQVPSSI
jgi:hypothetical protein